MGKVALIGMEMLVKDIPTYAGGMGILLGDFLLTAKDLKYEMIGVTLLHDRGYVRYKIEGNNIIPLEEEYEALEELEKEDVELELETKAGKIVLNVWRYDLGKTVSVYFLDSNNPKNKKEFRKLTRRLYIEDSIEEKILKYVILGVGALKLIENLGIDVKKYHIHESHGIFLAIELFKRVGWNTKEKIIFTTHTPLYHGHERFSYNIVEKFYDIPEEIKKISGDCFFPTKILYTLSKKTFSVSRKHKEVVKKFFGIETDYITNGVHIRWVSPRFSKLYDKYIENWRENPELLADAGRIPLEELERTKKLCKRDFVEYINVKAYLNKEFDKKSMLIAIRRRFTEYKRVSMPLWRIERLEELGKKYKIQLFFSGVFHPKDQTGYNEMKKILDAMSVLSHVRIALMPFRGTILERFIISGSDLLLHTSKPPFEACGTSWMRAGINGVPALSSRDGGVLEIIIDNYNGWLFGENSYDPNYPYDKDLDEFYRKLEEIVKLFYEDKKRYLDVCRNAIKTIGSLFNSKRMFLEYVTRGYEI